MIKTYRARRIICILLTILVFAFICDSDCIEQGRFMQNLQRVSQDSDVTLSVISVPFDYTDAMVESRVSQTQPIELRVLSRQTRKTSQSTKLCILLFLIILFLSYKVRYLWGSSLFIIPGETSILRYIMLQDGKK